MLRPTIVIILCQALLSPLAAQAGPLVTFEDLDDLTPLSGQFAGLSFRNAVVWKAQFTLNEGEFPPHSGSNVAVNEGGPLVVDFQTPVQSVAGFLTYGVPITITAFQQGGAPLPTLTTLFSSNLAVSGVPGSTPNEGFGFTSALGIVSIVLGDASLSDGAYALDDLSVAAAAAVPEPASAQLVGLGLGALVLLRRRRRVRRDAALACIAATLPLGALALGEIGTLTLDPPSVPSKIATDVVVTAKVVDPKVTDGTLVLQSVDPDTGAIKAVLGTLKDDGKNGDAVAGDKVHTLKTSINIDKPLHVRVSYGVNGAAKRLTCRTIAINTDGGPLTTVSPAAVQTFLDANKDVKTAAQLLGSLPAEYKRHWIFMTQSESAQKASVTHPRLLVPSKDASNIFAFEIDDGSGTRTPSEVEYLAFDAAAGKFTFQSVDMAARKVVDHNADTRCSVCHSGRPNWDAYDNWGGMLPFNRDRLYEGSIEAKAMVKILKDLRADALVSRLELPQGFSTTCDGDVKITFDSADVLPTVAKKVPYTEAGGVVTFTSPADATAMADVQQGGRYRLLQHSGAMRADEGRGVTLFDLLSAKNAKRVARSLIDQDRSVVDLRPVALAIADTARACGFTTLTDYAPQNVLDKLLAYHGVASLDALVTATAKLRQTLPQLKANLQSQNLNGPNGLIMKGGNEAPNATNIAQEIFRRSKQSYQFDKIIGATIDREIYGDTKEDLRIALFRLFLEPSKVSVGTWSMSVDSIDSGANRSATYTFGDVFGPRVMPVYLDEIRTTLNAQAGFAAMTCAQLQAASSKSFKDALAAKPAFFNRP